jgi:hypothetical protein
MSRHAQPHPSGGWLPLVLAVVTALGGASIASNVAAGPGRVAIGWATVLASALFLLQYRAERHSSLRLARIDHARRRDAVRLREELAEAHHRSRLAVERSYAAVARAEGLAAEVAQLMTVIRATPAPVTSVQVLPMMTPAPVQPAPAAAVLPAPAGTLAPAASNGSPSGASFELPLVASRRETPFAPPSVPAPATSAPATSAPSTTSKSSPSPSDLPARARVDLRAVESVKARYPRGA